MFEISENDFHQVVDKLLESRNPLRIKVFPAKAKRKYILLSLIIDEFDKGKKYTEKEVNQIIKPIYPDFVTIRRYLIDYHFLGRFEDGSCYWVLENHKSPFGYK